MSATVVDASVWVSRLVSLDTHHALSRQWLEHQMAEGGQLVSPVLLLSEVAGAISRRTGDRSLARQAVKHLLRLPALRIVPIDHSLGNDSAQLAADLGLRGPDAVYVAVAQRLNIHLFTWDQEQIEKTSKIIRAHLPSPGSERSE